MISIQYSVLGRHKLYSIITTIFISCIVIFGLLVNFFALGGDKRTLFVLLGLFVVVFTINSFIYFTQSKRWLLFWYIMLFFTLVPVVYNMNKIYHLVKMTSAYHFLATYGPALVARSSTTTPFTNTLTSITSLFVFERILEWMPEIKCDEWNPFSIGELRIHKAPALLLADWYFLYLIRVFLGYTAMQLFFEMIVLLSILFVVFWVKYPYPRQRTLHTRVIGYVKIQAHLPKSIHWLFERYQGMGNDAKLMELLNEVYIPLLHVFSRFHPNSLANENLHHIIMIVTRVLNPYSDTAIEKANDDYIKSKKFPASMKSEEIEQISDRHKATHQSAVSSMSFSIGLGLSKLNVKYLTPLWLQINSEIGLSNLHKNAIKIGIITGLVIDCQKGLFPQSKCLVLSALESEIETLRTGSTTSREKEYLEKLQRIIAVIKNSPTVTAEHERKKDPKLLVFDKLYDERSIMSCLG